MRQYVMELPYLKSKHQFINLNLNEISKYNRSWTHILILLTPTKRPITLNVDIYNLTERTLYIKMPKIYSFLEKHIVVETIIGSSLYKINIIGLEDPEQYLTLNIRPKSCLNASRHNVAHLCIPWAPGSSKYHHFIYEEYRPLSIYTSHSKPSSYNVSNSAVVVTLYIDPECRYIISYQNSIGGLMHRVFLQYHYCIPSHILAILLLSLKQHIQPYSLNKSYNYKKQHFLIINEFAFVILLGSHILAKLLRFTELLPQPELWNQSLVASTVISGTSLTIVYAFVALIRLIIYIHCKVYNIKFLRWCLGSIFFQVAVNIEGVPLIIAAALVSTAVGSCGGFSLMCMCLIYFILIIKKYMDYWVRKCEKVKTSTLRENKGSDFLNLKMSEEVKQKFSFNIQRENSVNDYISEANLHMVIFLLVIKAAILNFPATISWTKNFRFSVKLSPDPSFLPSIIMITSTSVLWKTASPQNVCIYKTLCSVLYTLSIVCVLYCQTSMYRLNYVISLAFILLMVDKLCAWKRTESQL